MKVAAGSCHTCPDLCAPRSQAHRKGIYYVSIKYWWLTTNIGQGKPKNQQGRELRGIYGLYGLGNMDGL